METLKGKENQENAGLLSRPITRRQAIMAGGIAVVGLAFSKPLIETVMPKPAFANYTPTGGSGCTPGFWKNHTGHWPAGYNTTDLYSAHFAVPAAFASSLGGTNTLLQVLQQGGGCEKALGRHSVAALLNAATLGSGFGPTPADVVTAVNAALAAGDCPTIETAKNNLQSLNETACPLGGKVAED